MTLPKYIFPLSVLHSVHLWSSLCSGHISFTHSYKINRMKIRKSVSVHPPHPHPWPLKSLLQAQIICLKLSSTWTALALESSSIPIIVAISYVPRLAELTHFYFPLPFLPYSLLSVSQDFCWPLELISFDPDTCYVSCKLSPQLTKPDCWPLLLRDLGVRKTTQTAWHHSRSRWKKTTMPTWINVFVGPSLPWAKPFSGQSLGCMFKATFQAPRARSPG